MSLESHWDNIFDKSDDCNLGWWEDDVSQSLKFLDDIKIQKDSNIFLSGAGTSMLVDELIKKDCNLILNDISQIALDKLKDRLDENDKLEFFRHDISKTFEDKNIDIWIDRAVLHFLLDEEDIKAYFLNLKSNVKKGGYVLFAEFRDGGATKCASLPIKQYSLSQLSKRLGNNFKLLKDEEFDYTTPSGDIKEYIYALYIRVGDDR